VEATRDPTNLLRSSPATAAVRDVGRVNAKPIPPIIHGYHRTSTVFGFSPPVATGHHRSFAVVMWSRCGRGRIVDADTDGIVAI
jgi:hypothetical protein